MAARVKRSVPAISGRSHGLAGWLVVSLTSFPPRFATLALTLKCLLAQSVRSDAIILWIAREDMAKLPADVLALQSLGVSIRACDDLGPYKKIVPLLEADADCFVVTADDDNCYPPDWLETLVKGQIDHPGAIVCHTARVIAMDDGGMPKPYRQWPRAVTGEENRLLPTGFGGVLYPPGSLSPEVTDRALFQQLSPTADDLWLKWMSARCMTGVHLVRQGGPLFEWPGSQRVNLVRTNIGMGGNDTQVRALADRYGLSVLG